MYLFPFIKKGYDLRLGPVSFVLILKNPKKNFILNKEATDIIKMCDGTNTVEIISRNLAEIYDEEYESALESVQTFLNSVEYIDFASEKTEVGKSRWGDSKYQRPVHVSVELTYDCNFRCKHCYNESGSEHKSYINTREFIKVLDELYVLGVTGVELTGGEPLLHPDFRLILEHCLELFDLVAVLTNGYLITENLLDCFTQYNDKLAFQVDLHGEKEYMDWFCNKKDAFNHVSNSIKLITEKDFILRVAMTVTNLNYKQVMKTVELAKKLDSYPKKALNQKVMLLL
ncbi:MAG: PqqD family peptide modification chaperone [Methanobrevibacter sp.]|jgi:sulfatase maturation enzyme AslB (radical SAM superfamily)|nr:PqqD family peptide modification chaperone [Candidatus Methanovirga procula]